FVYRHMERRGIVPGRDVDIVSCDNERELLSLMRPTPPSIDLNRDMIARLAVERLLWRMKNGVTSPSVVVTVSPTLLQQDPSHASNGNGLGNGNGSSNGNGHANGKVATSTSSVAAAADELH